MKSEIWMTCFCLFLQLKYVSDCSRALLENSHMKSAALLIHLSNHV